MGFKGLFHRDALISKLRFLINQFAEVSIRELEIRVFEVSILTGRLTTGRGEARHPTSACILSHLQHSALFPFFTKPLA